MNKIYIISISANILLSTTLLFYRYYLLTIISLFMLFGLLYYIGKTGSKRYIADSLLLYIKKNNGATRYDILKHLEAETCNKVTISIDEVNKILDDLDARNLVSITGDKITPI